MSDFVLRSNVSCSLAKFRKALAILVLQPHAIDKSLLGTDICYVGHEENHREILDKFGQKEWSKVDFDENDLVGDQNKLIVRLLVSRKYFGDDQENGGMLHPCQFEILLWHSEKSFLQVSTVDSSDVNSTNVDYTIEHNSTLGEIIVTFKNSLKKSIMTRTLNTLSKWCRENSLNIPRQSQRLVGLRDFSMKYKELKSKYAQHVAERWTESTDPSKFIHEDVSLASYIILVWEKETRKPSFIDLGCGNGLLVYILTMEGYNGTGVDLRSRKIWNVLHEAELKVETVMPSAASTYPKYDWLIGNHSDELTPWLPVMAALTSYTTKFFLLPCCPFELTGKFQRRNNRESVYRDYLDYVKSLGEKCGFVMEEDRLRIPSTKRICFVGRQRNHEDGEARQEVLKQLNALLPPPSASSQLSSTSLSEPVSSASPKRARVHFEPRSTSIQVRNCTQVSKSVTQRVVFTVVNVLLAENRPLSSLLGTEVSKPSWNMGGELHLNQVASLVSEEDRAEMKNECGGLQTLLRNHNHVFVVQQGRVRLRCHCTDDHEKGRKRRSTKKEASSVDWTKSKLCWFYENHPQGCPIEKEQCKYAHGQDDLVKPLCD